MVNESDLGDAPDNLVPVDLEVQPVNFKNIQPLFKQNPTVWFSILESQFEISNIRSEKTRYAHAIVSIDSRLHDQLADFISSDRGDKPYTLLKETVTKILSESATARLNNVLHNLTLADRKPSQLLSLMKLNAGTSFNENVLKQIWMSRLPSQIRITLSMFENEVALSVLAEKADKMLEMMPPHSLSEVVSPSSSSFGFATPSPVSSASANACTSHAFPHSCDTASLDARFNSLKIEMINEMERIHKNSNPSRKSPSRSRSRSRSKLPVQIKNGICFYHDKFGGKARKCDPACRFFDSFNASKSGSDF